MPLAAPVPERRKFFCPKCGARYSVTNTQLSKNEAKVVKCVVCLQVMDHSDSKNVRVAAAMRASSACWQQPWRTTYRAKNWTHNEIWTG